MKLKFKFSFYFLILCFTDLIFGQNISDTTRPIKVKIVSIPKADSFWHTFVYVAIPAFFVGIALWFIQYISQKRLANKQNEEHKKEVERLESIQLRENFEKSFFNILSHQNEILRNIALEVTAKGHVYNYSGVEFFNYIKFKMKLFYNYQLAIHGKVKTAQIIRYKLEYNNYFSDSFFHDVSNFAKIAKASPAKDTSVNEIDFMKNLSKYTYQHLFDVCYDYLGHYFRHLFNILKYLENKDKDIVKYEGDVNFYAGMIQARMSFSELFVLFYDALLFEKMSSYIDKYHLIENLPQEELINVKHQEFYNCKMKSKKYYNHI